MARLVPARTTIAEHDFGRAFAIGIALNLGFVLVEPVFGFLANSMALVADAGHNLSDVLGLVVAWAGAVMAKTVAFAALHLRSQESLDPRGARSTRCSCWSQSARSAAEAIRRLFHPSAHQGRVTMIGSRRSAILVNGVTALLFARGREHDINVRGAFLHMAADAAVSAAVVFAGLVILWTGQQWVDPVMSLAVAAVILWGSIGLLKESRRDVARGRAVGHRSRPGRSGTCASSTASRPSMTFTSGR